MSGPIAEGHTEHRDYLGAKFGMWLFLFTEILLFGGLFLLYSVYRSRFPLEFHDSAADLSVLLGGANTLILLTSSLSMALAVTAIQRGNVKLSVKLQWVTVGFGLLFLVNKYFEWSGKISHGMYPGSPHLAGQAHGAILFYGLYYVMTGLHGVHVLIGMGVIGVMAVLTARGSITGEDFVKVENAGLYWHLVDLIWIYLFPLFYLIT
jgi:cytochrome c oxidase subunit 3